MDRPAGAGPGIGVVGMDHLHLYSILDGLVRAGARCVAHTDEGDLVELYTAWQTASEPRSLDALLADPDIDVIATAAVPARRAEITLAALRAGKAVISAKPGVTSRAQLDAVRTELAGRPGRAWTVLFTERFENRAVAEAVRLARTGAVGRIVAIRGAGPHALAADTRPAWFWDPDDSGGIIVDLASHQVDQFLALLDDPDDVEVRAAALGNVATPEHPRFSDVGSFTLAAAGAQGDHQVDLCSPDGLGTWGDVRLGIVGTTGTLEVRANIDVGGEPGGEHLFHVDAHGARRVDVTDVALDWAERFLADVADDGERLMTQAHVLAVSDLTLRAQELARPWGEAR